MSAIHVVDSETGSILLEISIDITENRLVVFDEFLVIFADGTDKNNCIDVIEAIDPFPAF